jgi:hypothetical protein
LGDVIASATRILGNASTEWPVGRSFGSSLDQQWSMIN